MATIQRPNMHPIAATGFFFIAQVSSATEPDSPAKLVRQQANTGGILYCTTGGAFFGKDEDQEDVALIMEAQREGPATAYSDLRKELGL